MSSALAVKRASRTAGEQTGGRAAERGRGPASIKPKVLPKKHPTLVDVSGYVSWQAVQAVPAVPERDRLSQWPCPRNFIGSGAPCNSRGVTGQRAASRPWDHGRLQAWEYNTSSVR
jgi:hypothetical protein